MICCFHPSVGDCATCFEFRGNAALDIDYFLGRVHVKPKAPCFNGIGGRGCFRVIRHFIENLKCNKWTNPLPPLLSLLPVKGVKNAK